MKRFEDFLLKHPIQHAELSKALLDEFDHCRRPGLNGQSRLVLSIIIVLLRFVDTRLRDYHNWLHDTNHRRHL